MSIYGYIRVSSQDQNTDRQHEALKEYAKTNNIKFKTVFQDKASGKDFDRPQYQALKNSLKPGDTLIVKELDRLGRNKDLIKQELDYFKQQKIRVKILNIPTTLIDLPKESDWVFEMINNILIEVMGAIAEEERNKIHLRQAEGIAAAKEKGVKFGRPERSLPKDFEKYYKKWKADEITAVEFSKLLGVSRATLYRHIKEYEV